MTDIDRKKLMVKYRRLHEELADTLIKLQEAFTEEKEGHVSDISGLIRSIEAELVELEKKLDVK